MSPKGRSHQKQKTGWDVPPQTENKVGHPTANRKQGGTSHHKQKTGWDIPPQTKNRVGRPTTNRKQGGTSHHKQKTGWDIPPERENSEMEGSICRSVGGIQWTVKQSCLSASMQQSYRLLMPGRGAEQGKT